MMFLYIPVKESLYKPETGKYLSFGIKVYSLTERRCSVISSLSDISSSEDFVSYLALNCTRSQLSPLHLRDIVFDAI